MTSVYDHRRITSESRVSQTLRNDRCQNILYKAVFEHFIEIRDIAALLVTSKSFQNSSFGANFLLNFVVDEKTMYLLESFLSPSSCLSLQFVPSLHIAGSNHRVSNYIHKLVKTKYLHLSLRSLTVVVGYYGIASCFFGSSTRNAWPQLQELTLEYCQLDDVFLNLITKSAPHLRAVNFSRNTDITEAGLERVSHLSNITSLQLACCHVTDAGLEHISKLSGITVLDLHSSAITDVGLEHLSQLNRITSLDLSNSGSITDVGLESISQLSGITFLGLWRCHKITDVGLVHISKLSRIKNLNLTWCDEITNFGLEHVAKLSKITSLNLSSCDNITDVGLEIISQLSGITALDLAACIKIRDAGLEHISRLSKITTLNLDCCKRITDIGLAHISKLSNITSLNLERCEKITDAGLEHIYSKLSCITSLNVRDCCKITDSSLEHIIKFSRMTNLNLFGCKNITREARKKIMIALPDCHITE